MDGSASAFDDLGTGADPNGAPALDAISIDLPRSPGGTGRAGHRLSLAAAAAAHLILIVALLPSASDTLGHDGVVLDTIAVSIVNAVPVISAPEAQASDGAAPLPEPDAPPAPSVPDPPVPQTEQKEIVPDKPSLALDLPPEQQVPPPDALALPARQPDALPAPVVDDTPPPERREDVKTAAAPAPVAPPPAPAVLASASSAEAAAGVVRAYARRISTVLDRNKPKARGLRGELRVQFVVDTNGRAQPPKVLATSGNPKLDELIVAAIQRMEFPPPPPEMSPLQRTFNVPFAYR